MRYAEECNKMQSNVCYFHLETGSPDLGESQQVKFITLYPFASLSQLVLRWTFTLDGKMQVCTSAWMVINVAERCSPP